MFRPMKPETIERRKREAITEAARIREIFLQTYATAHLTLPIPQDPPRTGSRYSADLPDGRCVIISCDRITVF